jgi:ankyrin repeat protein
MNHHLKDLDEMSPIEKAIVVDSLCGENTLEAVIWDNVNFVNQDRLFLPITVASVLGNSHAVRLLIQAGAEVNRTDRFGNSPSYYATVRDDKETIELGRPGACRTR